ncbi:hypothetical protein PUN28_001234 [Cardiocondyla obscurior]|uniref:Uncharacterized protein n=1 Tax=Cardiocondyla obscurior TaxID=286306 RepID=A0AAW2H402_9HYME
MVSRSSSVQKVCALDALQTRIRLNKEAELDASRKRAGYYLAVAGDRFTRAASEERTGFEVPYLLSELISKAPGKHHNVVAVF